MISSKVFNLNKLWFEDGDKDTTKHRRNMITLFVMLIFLKINSSYLKQPSSMLSREYYHHRISTTKTMRTHNKVQQKK